MAKKFLYPTLCCLLATFSFTAKAQFFISGRVLSESRDQPLAGASVYINGSTIGTTTNDSGYFKLPAIGNGFYDIIVSYVGYEILAYHAVVQSQDIRIIFKLKQKITQLRNVVVLSKSGREKWLAIFRKNFLGETLASRRCSIQNEDEILFEDGGRDSIKAFSAVPLEIVNKELGYRIFFELIGFSYNAFEQSTYFYGYSRFEELKEDQRVPERYIKNRQRYYTGSTLHFYHSLIDDHVKEEGFNLLNIRTISSGNQKPKDSSGIKIDSSTKTVNLTRPQKMAAGIGIVRNQIIKKDSAGNSEVFVLNWPEKLRVIFTKDPYGKTYLQRSVGFMQGSLPKGVSSDLILLESPAYMDANGCLYNPLAIQMSGYWSYEKLANMLPLDYRPPR